jgi:hypothetical protein
MIHLQEELFDRLRVGGLPEVFQALQNAIELEHATIPVYLYALYSLDSTKNGTIASILESVVTQEMLHMALACNVLNALGGSPEIDASEFIPTYPGPLPGGVQGQLTVHLAPYSVDQLCTFLAIEEPEYPLNFPSPTLDAATSPLTIGQYYMELKRQIEALGPGAFANPPRNQLGPELMPDVVVVTGHETAVAAIDTIIEQGEGTSQSPLEAAGSGQLAHYYRFKEIAKGRRLIPNPNANSQTPPDEQFIYAGDPILFDQTGVYPVPSDPKVASYPPGSAARHACDLFNYTYTGLLQTLHLAFNGQPARIRAAIGLMESLKVQAKGMMSGGQPSGLTVGPSFEHQPTEPA